MSQPTFYMTPPQLWCGQDQPHGPHTWAQNSGLYAQCAGHS